MSSNEKTILLTSVFGLCCIVLISFCYSEPYIQILSLRANSEQSILTTQVRVHNRSYFDVNLTIHQTLVRHDLYLNLHLKIDVAGKMRSFQRWKNIDLCRFLNREKRDPLLNYMFESSLQNNSGLVCPFKVGFLSINDAYLDASTIPPIVPKTKYRFFLEVSQLRGDRVKLFSLQIDAVYCPF